MVKPITPAEATRTIHDAVVDAFNELIRENISGKRATVTQQQAVVRIMEKAAVSREIIFEQGWLDVEPIFRAAGWRVTFNRHDYTGREESVFIFEKP